MNEELNHDNKIEDFKPGDQVRVIDRDGVLHCIRGKIATVITKKELTMFGRGTASRPGVPIRMNDEIVLHGRYYYPSPDILQLLPEEDEEEDELPHYGFRE